jgi:hypothetical protein
MKRAKHTLSHYRMVTGDMGDLMPIGCVPVLPGDTFQHSTEALVRVSPLNTPVMHPVTIRIHHWFVPNRISWPANQEDGGWETFITGGPDGTDDSRPPTTAQTDNKKSVLSYLGVPPVDNLAVNAISLRAYNLIVNSRYRDQDLQPVRNLSNNELFKCGWEKDYFTTSRPFTQKGPGVSVPIGVEAPVYAKGLTDEQTLLRVQNNDKDWINMDTQGGLLSVDPPPSTQGADFYADLAAATGVDVNEFRTAFALQRYQEARARYGSRFTEYLRYLGITPSDARLQEPEYLGGGTTRLNFSEVLQTTPGQEGEAGVGDLYGHGIAGVRSNAYRKFFEEHGYVITLMSVRPKAIYVDGLPREFKKLTKEDYFQRELANLGQQEVYDYEVFGNNQQDVFGYQDRYDEYRQQWSQVSQDFRDTLNAWHLGREFAQPPTLNGDFIQCDPSKRIYQVPGADGLWIMANHRLVARRMVPKRANPRIN